MTSLLSKTVKIIEAAESIKKTSAYQDGSLGFMARSLVQATLPHSDPGEVKQWGRENGNIKILIEPGYTLRNNQLKNLGIPYGILPRLLLLWITSEAVKTKSKEIKLGKSLASFMRALGLNPHNGGARSDAVRLKMQMTRLFSAKVAVISQEEKKTEKVYYNITSSTRLWWDLQKAEKDKLFTSSISLSSEFFKEIIKKPVPVDMRALDVLKQSPLALDLYTWLTYRVSYLSKKQIIAWSQLHSQFGSDFNNISAFKLKAGNYLKRIKILYPALRIEESSNGLILYPSPTHVPRLKNNKGA